MSVEIFIAKRILSNRSQDIKVSRPILRIAIISISLSIVVNLLTIAVTTGFQHEITRKVTGFSAPLFIQNQNNADFYESDAIHVSAQVENTLKENKLISGFNRVAYKPGLIQTTGKGTDVNGIVFKGIDAQYNLSFLSEHIVRGHIPNFNSLTPSNEIVLSSKIAKRLKLSVNDEIAAFFVKDSPVARRFKIAGIYNTGFEDYDEKLIICDIRVTQKLNDWGVNGQLDLYDSVVNDKMVVALTIHGKSTTELLYDWGNGPNTFWGQLISPTIKDTTIKVSVLESNPNDIKSSKIIEKCKIHIQYLKTLSIEANDIDKYSKPFKEVINNNDLKYKFFYPLSENKVAVFLVESFSGEGTSNQFISGYEIQINDWYKVSNVEKEISKKIKLIPNEHGELIKVVSIFDLEKELFNWLAFLDINVYIILTLMILIGIINMGSALLILIIIRSNFIGLMKSMGSSNWSLQKIFLIQAGYLIGLGMLIGNLIGIGIYLLQVYTGFLSLDPQVYYLDKVPMELNPLSIALLNAGSFFICMAALFIPSTVIARVNPIKTIKFN